MTDESGSVVLQKDYLPYGSSRIESGTTDSHRGFIGQFEDSSTNLSYLNARYYDGGRGQFTSQDPVFWEIDRTKDGKAVLENPQAQNSYSYAGGNPVTKKDPSGRCVWDACVAEISTAPIWVPVALAASAAIVTETTVLMSKNQNWGGRYAGPRQIPDYSDTNGFKTPDPLDNNPPNFNPRAPKWKIGIILAAPVIGGIVDLVDDIKDKIQSASNLRGSSAKTPTVDSNTRQLLQKLKPFMTSQAQKALTKAGI